MILARALTRGARGVFLKQGQKVELCAKYEEPEITTENDAKSETLFLAQASAPNLENRISPRGICPKWLFCLGI